MVKRIVTLGLTCIMLAGSVVFPLGDFSLTRDLPGMYRNYLKIVSPDESGIADFIGDYLLHGKEIFGHNKQDKQQNGINNIQFQHQPAPFYVLLIPVYLPKPFIPLPVVAHPAILVTKNTSGFKNKLFRPPLA